MKNRYDYIIAGAGCSGLSLLLRLLHAPAMAGREILLVDKSPKTSNDRTWCFWERDAGFFEAVVYRRWDRLKFISATLDTGLAIAPYQYKMIRGIDFYAYCFQEIRRHPNVTVAYTQVSATGTEAGQAYIETSSGRVYADYVFNSIVADDIRVPEGKFMLLQHFKGWLVRADHACFDPDTATLMDFRASQARGPAFFYTLPLSSHSALVEYTLFSPRVLEQQEYDRQLEAYLRRQLPSVVYTKLEEEFGVIPMTNYTFPTTMGRVVNLGKAAGRVKPSSGYAFRAIQKHADSLVESLLQYGHPFQVAAAPKKYDFYDAVMLNILHRHPADAPMIFTRMFAANDPATIFRFLDNESGIREDLRVINSLRSAAFLKAGLSEFIKKATG